MTFTHFPNAVDEVGPGASSSSVAGGRRSIWHRMMATKPREYILMEEDEELQTSSVGLTRQLGLFDLLMIGIGGTVGTGVFALAGLIAHEDAGPAVILSWAVAALGCTLNGFAYMELSSLVPSSGSVYAYSYHALGEVFAVVAAWCLTLEYGVSGAAVARSWGTKVVYWIQDISGDQHAAEWMDKEYYSLTAAFLQALCVGLLLCGLSLGKHLVNAMTVIKIVLIVFMTTAAFTAFDSENLTPFVPPQFRAGGVLTGGTAAFFGFIGFDEVCCMAGEAKNPTKVMPRAVVGTIVGTAVLSIVASLALVGMCSYTQIDSDAGFASGFRALDWNAIAHITQAGEVLTLPIVVFIAFLAQPRLLFAMANDGLAPKLLCKLDERGNIFYGTLLSGSVLILVALCVPFSHLDDMVSAGVLISFSLCNCCLLTLRYKSESPTLFPMLLWPFVIISAVAAFLWQQCINDSSNLQSIPLMIAASTTTTVAISLVVALWMLCPQVPNLSEEIFRSPLVPGLPTLAISFNWMLLAQLSTTGLLLISGWIALAVVSYFAYGFNHSHSHMFAALAATPTSSTQHSMLDTDLYRAPVRTTSWMYSNRRDRSASYCHTETLNNESAPRLVNQLAHTPKGTSTGVASSVP